MVVKTSLRFLTAQPSLCLHNNIFLSFLSKPGSKSQLMNAADILCSVAPVLAKFLERADLINYDSEAVLFNCLKRPIARAVYDCIAQDGCADALFVYLQQRSEIRCLTNFNYLPGYVDCADANVQRFFERLCALGFREEDEDKLLHLKEFMDKTRIWQKQTIYLTFYNINFLIFIKSIHTIH